MGWLPGVTASSCTFPTTYSVSELPMVPDSLETTSSHTRTCRRSSPSYTRHVLLRTTSFLSRLRPLHQNVIVPRVLPVPTLWPRRSSRPRSVGVWVPFLLVKVPVSLPFGFRGLGNVPDRTRPEDLRRRTCDPRNPDRRHSTFPVRTKVKRTHEEDTLNCP